MVIIIIGTIAGLLLGFVFSYYLGNKVVLSKIKEAEDKSKSFLETATKNANAMQKEKLLEIKEEFSRKKLEFESEVQLKKTKLQQTDNQLKQKEENLKQRNELLQKKEHSIIEFENELKKIEEK